MYRSLAFVLSIMLVAASCKEQQPIVPPQPKLNLHPAERYKVVLSVVTPPGPIQVTGRGIYSIENNSFCTPMDQERSLGGSHWHFQEEMDLPLRKISENKYEAIFYADAYLNEDYYGMGNCNWRGSPRLYIHWAGANYAVANSTTTEIGTAVEKVCSIKPTSRASGCIDRQKGSPVTSETHFNVTLAMYKD